MIILIITGTGQQKSNKDWPIFGALMGACFGPVVFLWIILGSILAGGVHDYMCGMISERHDGASIAELSGIYLGSGAKKNARRNTWSPPLTPASLNKQMQLCNYIYIRTKICYNEPVTAHEREGGYL